MMWETIYRHLKSQGPGFMAWDALEALVGRPAQNRNEVPGSFVLGRHGPVRGALRRACVELEAVDGLTVTGQTKAGFEVKCHTPVTQ